MEIKNHKAPNLMKGGSVFVANDRSKVIFNRIGRLNKATSLTLSARHAGYRDKAYLSPYHEKLLKEQGKFYSCKK